MEERDEEEEQKEEDKEGEEAQEEEGSNISLVDKSISCFLFCFSFILRLTLVSRTWFGSQELQAKEKCVPRAQRRTMRRKTELLLSGFRLEVFSSDVSCQTWRFPV